MSEKEIELHTDIMRRNGVNTMGMSWSEIIDVANAMEEFASTHQQNRPDEEKSLDEWFSSLHEIIGFGCANCLCKESLEWYIQELRIRASAPVEAKTFTITLKDRQ